jgi:predicted RNA binding protein YcfA (HicA-like mRNA interferase family)
MPGLRNVRQDEAVGAFRRLGGVERATKKNYRMVTMPNGALLAIPGDILKIGTLRSLIRYAGLTVAEFEEALQ